MGLERSKTPAAKDPLAAASSCHGMIRAPRKDRTPSTEEFTSVFFFYHGGLDWMRSIISRPEGTR